MFLQWIPSCFNRYCYFVGAEGRSFVFKWMTMAYGIQPFVCFCFHGYSKRSVTWEFWNHLLFWWCDSKLKGDNIWILLAIYVFRVEVYITSSKKNSLLNKTKQNLKKKKLKKGITGISTNSASGHIQDSKSLLIGQISSCIIIPTFFQISNLIFS